MSALATCGCPIDEGLVRHQRATCTDPVVRRLGWYFDSGCLEGHAREIGAALDRWSSRDRSGAKAEPEIRHAVNDAMIHIDCMLAHLNLLRRKLVSEIRRADDAFMAHLDRKDG